MRALFALMLVLAGSSAAAKDVLAVVDLDAPPHLLGMQSQIQKAVIAEAAKQKLTVLDPATLLEKLGAAKFKELSKCADRPGCAAQSLQGTGANKVVTGKLSLTDKNYVLKLYLLDLDKMAVLSDVDRQVLIASRRLQKDVEAAVPGLLRGEREARGTLVINVTVPNAQVSINGDFIGVNPVTEQLKPGKYEVKVEKKNYLPVTRLVDVEPNQKKVEEIRLLLIPGMKAEEDIIPPVAGGTADGDGKAVSISAPTWIFGALTVAAAGTGIAFGVLASNGEKKLLEGYDEMNDRYAGTRQQALDAKRNALIANVAFGVAGAMAVATVVFAILDGTGFWDSKGEVEVAPVAAPGGGGLVLGGRF